MLTISVKNFGPIAEGSVDLKPLTIFVGPSNTGKSYMATAVYAFAKAARSVAHEVAFNGRTVRVTFRAFLYGLGNRNADETLTVAQELQQFAIDETTKRDLLVSDLPEFSSSWLANETAERLRIVQQHTLDQLLVFLGEPSEFTSYHSQGSDFSLSVNRTSPRLHLEIGLPETINAPPTFDIFSLPAPVEAIELLRGLPPLQESNPLPPGANMLLVDPILSNILANVPAKSYYLPASRTGILKVVKPLTASIFRQASFPKSQEIDLPLSLGVTSEFLADFVALDKKTKSSDRNDSLDKAVAHIESNVLQGEIELEEAAGLPIPEIAYSTTSGRFTLNQTSSMVSELAPLVLFLKYLVRPGDLLIIEEPESHLHPAAQRQLARGIVRLVNAGVQVLITTHSDLFVSQINNQMRISYASKRWLREHGFTPDDTLKHDDVSAYLFRMDKGLKGSLVEKLEIQRDIGIDNPEFTKAINELYDETLLVERVRPK